MLISVYIIQFHRTGHLSERTCVWFVIHSGGMRPLSHSLMEYRESVFPSIHHSDNIDPNNKFITMCYPLFLTQVCFCRLDLLLSDYPVQEHFPESFRWSIHLDTFYEIQSFVSVITLLLNQHILCRLYQFTPYLNPLPPDFSLKFQHILYLKCEYYRNQKR